MVSEPFLKEKGMSKRGVVFGLGIVLLLATLWVGQALSQEGERPTGERSFRGRSGRFDPERMRQAMLERLKETLGATDEDWKVLGPRVEKVQTLSSQLRSRRGMAAMFMRRGPRRDVPEGSEATREQTKLEKAQQELRTTLENQEAKPKEIQEKLTALRTVREKVKQDMARAQQQLRELLTTRQEAQLVLMGLLD